ncbi:hypothetical protein EV121DRAFT_297695, partial [Schizophyllum commune]
MSSNQRGVMGLGQVYTLVAEADPAYVQPFILENEDFAVQALELWLRFPLDIQQSAVDESRTSHTTVVVAHTPSANEVPLPLFRPILKGVAQRRHMLYLAAAMQTKLLKDPDLDHTSEPSPTELLTLAKTTLGLPQTMPYRVAPGACPNELSIHLTLCPDETDLCLPHLSDELSPRFRVPGGREKDGIGSLSVYR